MSEGIRFSDVLGVETMRRTPSLIRLDLGGPYEVTVSQKVLFVESHML